MGRALGSLGKEGGFVEEATLRLSLEGQDVFRRARLRENAPREDCTDRGLGGDRGARGGWATVLMTGTTCSQLTGVLHDSRAPRTPNENLIWK